MALKIPRRQEDGVTTEYHRILYIQIAPNECNCIAVASYVDSEARHSEQGELCLPYKQGKTYTVEYDENMTVEGAYDMLKTLPDFKGAEDC